MVPAGGRQPPQCYPPHPFHTGVVSYTLHHCIFNVLLPMKYLYSSDRIPTIKISCAIITYVLATYYPYTFYMIPLSHPTHPTGGGGVK